MAAMQLTRTHRILISVVVTGAVIIAAIGFAGSYAAVRELAEQKGFGNFSLVFPIGIDAGICVLLALDLLLTWMRIPFPLLRQTAWLLTAATIAFNGAASWPDPLGVGMHAVIPMLFVVSVEAARHAVGRIADITADKHMEGVRLTRWLLSPIPTFKLWRRMKLWEIRSYEEIIQLEQDRLIYQARLQARYGRSWRRKIPIESLMPLRLARYGVPLAQTAPAGLAAAGIEVPIVTVQRVDTATDAQPPYGHDRALDAGENSEAAGHQDQERATPRKPGMPAAYEPAAEHEAEPVDYFEAFRHYVTQHSDFPNARQFGLFLAEIYGVVDPVTGGPLTEAQLRPVLHELRQYAAEQVTEPVADESVMTDAVPDLLNHEGVTDPAAALSFADSHPFFGTSSIETVGAAQPQPYEAQRVPTLTASVADDPMASGGVQQEPSLDAPAPQSSATAAAPTGESALWEATVTDTGESTARVPEQRVPELDAEEQRIETVAGWLAEAEEAGVKLSGAEVARRLEVSPRTGQRLLGKAKEYRQEQLRQQGRAHLRSVTNRP
ncbi:DUF2637 domain-containing protein [Streptomyces sp. NPDC051219]|uniref:DUF2637 domain-containing protein n=1 Tax=Streptomyces sp. NPDC051219 TaxID=3155283 RepID=UPI00343D482E